jgi:hypothetical protein
MYDYSNVRVEWTMSHHLVSCIHTILLNILFVENGWYIFDNISSCQDLNKLFRLQVISIAINSLGVFVCVVSVLLLYHTWYIEKQVGT